MVIKKQEFDQKIIGKIKKFFEVKEQETHHKVFKIYHKGKEIIRTYRSHGGGEMSNKAIYGVRRQLFLTLPQLIELKNCPMEAEDYFNLLKQKNVISD